MKLPHNLKQKGCAVLYGKGAFMKFIPHRSSLFKLSANMVSVAGYLLLAIAVGSPIFNHFAVFACLLLFVFEKKSYMVQVQAMQTAFVAMFVEVFRSIGIFAISWGWQMFGWQDATIHTMMSVLVYGLMLVQAVLAVLGSVNAVKWKVLLIPGISGLSNWILKRSTGVKKEDYLDNSENDGVSLKKKM